MFINFVKQQQEIVSETADPHPTTDSESGDAELQPFVTSQSRDIADILDDDDNAATFHVSTDSGVRVH